MKKIIIAVGCLLWATTALAATHLKFSWTPNTDSAIGYQLMMGGETVQTITGRETATTDYTFDDEVGKCYTFTLIAYDAQGNTSDPSIPVVWCSTNGKPGGVIGLKIRVVVEPENN